MVAGLAETVSHVVIKIKIYRFACNWPDCTAAMEVRPESGTLREAERRLRHEEYWTAKGGSHYCSKHTDGSPAPGYGITWRTP